MSEVYVEKTGWEILRDFAKGRAADAASATKPVAAAAKALVEKLTIAYNPLALTPGDIVLLDVEGAEEMRFEVDRLLLSRRTIGEVTILSVDYILIDPTNDAVLVGLRALDEGKGKYSVLLLTPDGQNAYDEELEKMLNAMKPGDPTGFPRSEEAYIGFAPSGGVPFPYEVHVTEYAKGVAVRPYTKTIWGFVRDESSGDPVYLFEMNGTDGFFYCYSGAPLASEDVRVFRF